MNVASSMAKPAGGHLKALSPAGCWYRARKFASLPRLPWETLVVFAPSFTQFMAFIKDTETRL
ncbi:MAG TPA: hypothetical protein DHU56_10055 [Marinobacter sp.]|nr:hypothetical protein [Marinobacter sp.]